MKNDAEEQDRYIISGSGYRLLIWDLYSIFTSYVSLARKLAAAQTEKDFKRLQRQISGYEKRAYKRCRRWGIPKDCEAFACDTLEKAISERCLTSIPATDSEDEAQFMDEGW